MTGRYATRSRGNQLPAADAYVAAASRMCSPLGWTPSLTKMIRLQPIPNLTCSTAKNAAIAMRSPEFISRYRSAQVKRNHTITDWAESELETCSRSWLLIKPFSVMHCLGRPAHGRSQHRTDQASAQPVLRGRAGERTTLRTRHRRGLHAAPAGRGMGLRVAKPLRLAQITCLCLSMKADTGLRWMPQSTTKLVQRQTRSRSTPTILHHPGRPQQARADHCQVDSQAVALRIVPAHFAASQR